ncbi:hypothetical protein GCM10010199_46010 [Dactylosporangium roseum]
MGTVIHVLGPGDVLGDRYRLEEFVASGGMGQVFRATDTTLGRTVAVKVLLPGHTSNGEFGSRFRAEARIMAAIGHPGVVGVYDYGETSEGTMFLVMTFVDGRPLGERIAREGALPVDETLTIVAQAAEALQAAHAKGVIHRDVKPSNLLVADDGTVTLVDFGVARSSSVTSVTKVNAVIGTALYMSPEQARGGTISPSTDIYALGAVAYHCLTGAPPFSGNSPLEIAVKHLHEEPPPLPDDLPVAARALVEQAMEKDPEARFPSAAAMAVAAREAQNGVVRAVRASSPSVSDTAELVADDLDDDEAPRRPAWFPVAVGLALAALAVGVILALIALTREALDTDIGPATVPSKSAGVIPAASTPAPDGGAATRTGWASTSPSASAVASSAAPSSPAPQSEPPRSSPAPGPTSDAPPPSPDKSPTLDKSPTP